MSHVSHLFLPSFAGAFDAVLRCQDWDFEVDLEQKKEDTAFRQRRLPQPMALSMYIETRNIEGLL